MKKVTLILIFLLLSSCKANNKPSVSVNQLQTSTFEVEYGSLIKFDELFDNKDLTFVDTYLDTS